MSNTFCGFDIDRIESLRKELGSSSQAAGRMSSAVSGLVSRAAALQNSGPALHAMQIDGLSLPTDADRAGLTSIAGDAPGMAAEIGRRRAHLIACQKLSVDGFQLDSDVVFADEPPPDEGKVKAALDQFRRSMSVRWGINGNPDMQLVAAALAGLNAGETDAVIKQLSDDELRKWNDAITQGNGTFPFNGLGNAERMQLASFLAARLGSDSLARLAHLMPSLEPAFNVDGSHDGVHYGAVTGDLFTSGVNARDISQGGVGDCWFLAGLLTVADKNPGFIQDHVRQNDNGTYTVTLYKDGKPVEVTVDNQFPMNGGDFAAAHSDVGWSSHRDLWVAIYEKAFAALKGSYGATEGGFGDQALPVITGQDSGRMPADLMSLQMMQTMQQAGAVLTVGTGNNKFLGLFGGSDSVDHGKVVTDHEYAVKGFDNTADPPTVILWNPWGDGGGAPQEVRLTESQFHDYVDSVSMGKVPGG